MNREIPEKFYLNEAGGRNVKRQGVKRATRGGVKKRKKQQKRPAKIRV